MVVYVDDDEAVFVEQLSLDDAGMVLARVRAELSRPVNSAHAAALRAVIAEVEDQIDWLKGQERELAVRERAAEMASAVWVDYELGLSA